MRSLVMLIAFMGTFFLISCGNDTHTPPIDTPITVEYAVKEWGAASNEWSNGVAVDKEGNVYVTGSTEGAFDGNVNVGVQDVFLTKWNADGTKAWTKQWGGTALDQTFAVAVSSAGEVYVTGRTTSSDFDGNTNAGWYDVFLTKLNADGTKAWSKLWGSASDEEGIAVAVADDGSIYVAGETYIEDTSGGVYAYILLVKYRPDGTLVWAQQLLGGNGRAVAVGPTGDVYVAGYVNGVLEEVAGAGELDMFVVRWKNDGTKVWVTQWGSAAIEGLRGIAVDDAGNVYAAGSTYGAMPGNVNAGGDCGVDSLNQPMPCQDVVLAKLTDDGEIAWIRQWGAPGEDTGSAITVDKAGNVFVAGKTRGALDGQAFAGGDDVYLTKWNADGSKDWTRLWGSPGLEEATAVTADRSGNIYLTGASDGELGGNINAGQYDPFLVLLPAE